MAIVTVIQDNYGLVPASSNAMLIEEIQDYVPSYSAIQTAIHNNKQTTVIVRHKTCGHWLKRALPKYTDKAIAWSICTPRQVIESEWGVSAPPSVSDAEIIRSGLLDYDIRAKENQSFEDALLEYFFCPQLGYSKFPQNQLVDLLNSYDASWFTLVNPSSEWEKSQNIPLARRLYEKRLRQWSEKAQSEEERWLIELYRENPASLYQLLTTYKVIRGYPTNIQRRVLGDDYSILASLKLDVEQLSVKESVVKEAKDSIEIYLRSKIHPEILIDEFTEILESVNGCLLIEFNLIQEMLHSLSIPVTQELVAAVQTKFRPLQERIPSELAVLSNLVQPARPKEPQAEWTADEWMSWAVKEYLPYHFWLEEGNAADEEIASYVQMYGDWLYDNYLQLRHHYDYMLYKAFINAQGELTQSEYALVVVIDNLNLKFFDILAALLQSHGYSSTLRKHYLTLLPSETRVCKRCLLAGQPSNEDIHARQYDDIITQEWSGFFGSKKVKYVPSLGELINLPSLDSNIYFLNYRPIDEVLHQSAEDIGQSHTELIRQFLSGLVSSIDEFAKKFEIDDRLLLCICSDHGSTKIPKEMPNPIDLKFFHERCDHETHRFIQLSDAELSNLAENHRYQCYFLDRKTYGNDANYLIAKGYYRFKKTEKSFYVHGGCTPEETIVPFALFKKASIHLEKPRLSLLDNVFRYAVKSIIKLDIVNPNEYPLENVSLTIQQTDVIASSLRSSQPSAYDEVVLAEIPAKQVVTQKIPCRFARTAEKIEKLALTLHFQYRGQEQSFDYEFSITMKAMMESGFGIDNLFQ